MEIHATDGARFELALDRFEQGHVIVFRGVGISIGTGTSVEVRVPSSWMPENVTAGRAMHDIRLAEEAFAELSAKCERFAVLVRGKPVVILLLYDYGMGAMKLCRTTGSVIEWAIGYPKR